MSEYWPDDIDLEDVSNPFEILSEASQQWKTDSGGRVELVIQLAESKTGNKMYIVHARHVESNRTSTLFSVVHRPDTPYPVRIQPRENELPDFLKKNYHKRSPHAELMNLTSTAEQEIHNRWVSDTPSEFRDKLRDAFNLGSVKSEVFSLFAKPEEVNEIEGTVEDNGDEVSG